MYRIAESIEILSPPDKVFAFLSDVEARIRLNPSCTVIGFEELNSDRKGVSRFRFFFLMNGKRFKSEIVESVEKGAIVSRTVDGGLQVTLSVAPTANGTRLLHEEEFSLPDEALEPETGTVSAHTFASRIVQRVLNLLVGLDFHDVERSRKADAIISDMRQTLQTWLMRIKQKIEEDMSVAKERVSVS
jgi:hypothetical protein